MTSSVSKIGTVFYVIWGILHLRVAHDVYVLAMSLQAGMAQGRLLQSAWNLIALALAAIIVSVSLNWKNNKIGYWVNLSIISVTDVGFILFILVPGYVPLFPGIAGPVFWILGLIFTTFGYLSRRRMNNGV